MIDINNFTTSRFDNFDINLVQKEVGGGVVTVSQIDKSIKEKPNAKSIVISGLKQDTFDYFVHKYGRQFELQLHRTPSHARQHGPRQQLCQETA